MTDHAGIIATYEGSDAERTKGLYAELEAVGPQGVIAMNLLRAQKASERAKGYTRRYRGPAYDKKQWSMANACAALVAHGAGIVWGWGLDAKTVGYPHVLYIDLPTGQVSFHSAERGDGPDYAGVWDGQGGQSPARIMAWCAQVLAGESPARGAAPSSGLRPPSPTFPAAARLGGEGPTETFARATQGDLFGVSA